ncbi:hypothetical protein ACO0LB_21025, partial [Undibacterium sp. SXout7W]|uniref:hypothetical protein n=1 Tax=Undibacterium sp. SXout7W TaxID=3413049 RepID=UPI003BF3DF81
NDQLTITNQGELNNQSGKLLSASAISIDTQKVTNDSQNGQAGLIQSNGTLRLHSGSDISNQQGNIVSAGSIDLNAAGTFNNQQGTLEAA